MNHWYCVNKRFSTASVAIYDEIALGEGPTENDFISELEGVDQVDLTIDSSGGSFRASLAIYQALRTRHTSCIIRRAHSVAALIAMSAKHISVLPSATLMIHAPQDYVIGGPLELRAMADSLQAMAAPMLGVFSLRTGKPIAEVKEWLRTDTYFTAEQALENRLADSIIEQAPLQSRGFGAEVLIQDDGKAEFLLEVLQLLGTVRTDKRKLGQNLTLWFQSVQHIDGVAAAVTNRNP